jgi:hypothetical protein
MQEKNNDKVQIRDLQVGEDIMDIVEAEVRGLKGRPLELPEVVKLEKLSKVYSLLMSSLRENVKHNVFGKLDFTEELKDADDDTDQDADDT